MRLVARAALLSAVSATLACGGSRGDGSNAASGDAGQAQDGAGPIPHGSDYGAPSATYPAFPVDVAQVTTGRQQTIHAPVVVTVTWQGDPLASTLEAFGDGIGASSYWAQALGEYGVGAAASGAADHVRLAPAAPAQITDVEIAQLVQDNAGATPTDAGAAWPAPTAETIYAIYLPDGTKLIAANSGVDLCAVGVGGYHDNVTIAGNAVAYAVIPHCDEPSANPPVVFTDVDIEESASHELAEAATDPFPSTQVHGFQGFDDAHYAWDVWTGLQDELGDACEIFREAFYEEPPPFPYWVQRIWSNAGAAAGHDPCTPRLGLPYYDVTLFPSQTQDISVDLTNAGDTTHATKGFRAPVGQSVTFQVGFFSDADTGGPWTLSAVVEPVLPMPDVNGAMISNGAATVAIDHATGQNGEKAYVTITPTAPGQLGFQLVVIKSTYYADADATHPNHYMPLLVANQ